MTTVRERDARPPGGARKRLATWSLALVASLVSLGAVELVLRSAGLNDPQTPTRYRIPHPVLGWSLQPGADYVNPMPEGPVRVQVNSAGWRDVERREEKPDGVFRIVVLGDSFMESYSVELEEAFHRRLEARLGREGTAVEVLNLGVGGFGTLQEYLSFRDAGARYAPDLVLLAFCVANDVRNNSEALEALLGSRQQPGQRSRPFLEPGSAEWRISGVDFELARRRFERRRSERASPWNRLVERSATLQVAARVWSRTARRDEAPRPRDVDLALNGVHYCEEPPEYRQAWEVTGRILARLRDEALESGAPMAVFSAPTFRESSRKHIRSVESREAFGARVCLEEVPGYRRLERLLADLEVPFIDLLPEFRGRMDGQQLFHKSDRHWTAAGHDLATELVAERLAGLGLVP